MSRLILVANIRRNDPYLLVSSEHMLKVVSIANRVIEFGVQVE